jgi:hypothetical protein
MIGIYQMNEQNIPGIGEVLRKSGIDAVPEAHCYLKINGVRHDFTGLRQGASSPFDNLLLEHCVLPDQLSSVKVDLHKREIAAWAQKTGLSADEGWALREACIAALAATGGKPN